MCNDFPVNELLYKKNYHQVKLCKSCAVKKFEQTIYIPELILKLYTFFPKSYFPYSGLK